MFAQAYPRPRRNPSGQCRMDATEGQTLCEKCGLVLFRSGLAVLGFLESCP